MQSIFKIRSQNKGKGKVQTKRAAPSKRKRHARDQMPEDSDPFQDGTVLKEAFDRLNKYVVG